MRGDINVPAQGRGGPSESGQDYIYPAAGNWVPEKEGWLPLLFCCEDAWPVTVPGGMIKVCTAESQGTDTEKQEIEESGRVVRRGILEGWKEIRGWRAVWENIRQGLGTIPEAEAVSGKQRNPDPGSGVAWGKHSLSH